MSTKIYTGFIVKAASTQEAFALLGAQRPALERLANIKNHGVYIETIIDFVDGYCLHRHLRNTKKLPPRYEERDALLYSIGGYCAKVVREKQQACRASMERAPLEDCDIELSLYVDTETGHVMGMVQEERTGALKHLLTVPGIEDFAYWNNTDRPDTLTDEAWSERSKTWDRLLDSPTTPVVSLRVVPGYVAYDELLAEVPSLHSRAEECARNTVQNEALLAYKNSPEGIASKDSVSRFFTVLNEVRERLQDPTSAESEKVKLLTQEYLGYLVPDVMAHLSATLPELPGLPAPLAPAAPSQHIEP